jgi:putative ABC transport system substrate-binding protein
VKRRVFIAAVCLGLVAVPVGTGAQLGGKIPVAGVLNAGPAEPRSLDGARQGLRELDYVGGKTILLEVRHAKGNPEVLPALAAELVQKKVDVLLASGPAALKAAAEATRTIPVVAYDLESDPVQSGYARSLSQPGGNITGLFLDLPELTGKWLELIKEVAPNSRRVALRWDPTTGDRQLAAAKTVAHGLGMELQILQAQNPDQLESALLASLRALSGADRRLRAQASAPGHLHLISLHRRGGLMAYGPVRPEFGRRLGIYIDKILKGTRPGDLLIEQASKFELTINRKTTKAWGLTLPQSLLGRADRVIE